MSDRDECSWAELFNEVLELFESDHSIAILIAALLQQANHNLHVSEPKMLTQNLCDSRQLDLAHVSRVHTLPVLVHNIVHEVRGRAARVIHVLLVGSAALVLVAELVKVLESDHTLVVLVYDVILFDAVRTSRVNALGRESLLKLVRR